jgi:hypothetical protein
MIISSSKHLLEHAMVEQAHQAKPFRRGNDLLGWQQRTVGTVHAHQTFI